MNPSPHYFRVDFNDCPRAASRSKIARQARAFTAHRGKVNVLVGENGAGKSTLMKILSGSEQPSSGRILLDGDEVKVAILPPREHPATS